MGTRVVSENATYIIGENRTGALEFALSGEALGHETHTLALQFGKTNKEYAMR